MTRNHDLPDDPLIMLAFALEYDRADLVQLLETAWAAHEPDVIGNAAEQFVTDALRGRAETADALPIQEPTRFVIASTVAAVLAEHAEPLAMRTSVAITPPRRSSEHETPLQQNPGGSAVLAGIRDVFQAGIRDCVMRSDSGLKLAARVVLLDAEHHPDVAVTLTERDGTRYVAIPGEAATHRCLADPADIQDPPSLRWESEHLLVPAAILAAKLQRYAGHAFDRLTHIAAARIRGARRERVRAAATDIPAALRRKYECNHLSDLYDGKRYDTAGSGTAPGKANTGLTVAVHDHRLANIIDVIRATGHLTFGNWYTAAEIFAAARTYFPPPHRPANLLRSIQRVSGVLQSAAEAGDLVEQRPHDGDASVAYRITTPRFTPFYPGDPLGQHRWEAYTSLLDQQAYRDITAGRRVAVTDYDYLMPSRAEGLNDARARAGRRVATTPFTRSLSRIGPTTTQDSITIRDTTYRVSRDERAFLSRIAHAQQGLLADRTILDGMADYDTGLDVDIDRLLDTPCLTAHDTQYPTLYSVPRAVIEFLGVPTPTHECWGEDTPSESALHAYLIRLLAHTLRQRPDVDTVYTYVDLWRLQLDIDAAGVVERCGLAKTDPGTVGQRRLDVAALQDGTLRYAGEIQRAHGDASRVVRNWEKLRVTAAAGAQTIWVAPDYADLASIIRTLQAHGLVADSTLPDSERVTVLQSHLASKHVYNPGLASVTTGRQLYQGGDQQ